MSAQVAMFAPIILGATGTVFGVFGGLMADRYGRVHINVIPRLVMVVVAYPAFSLVTSSDSPLIFLCVITILVALHLSCLGAAAVVMAECFPGKVRASAYAIGYAFGVTIFGGTAQLVFTWLIHTTGNAASPIVYVILGNVITLLTVLATLKWQRANTSSGAGWK
jgi:nitrate/nitrite transporter NarK